MGISTALHIGTEPVLGLTMADVLKMFEKDEHGRQIYGNNPERTALVRKMIERKVGKGTHQQIVG